MSYLNDHAGEVKNAGYYRRQLKLSQAELARLNEKLRSMGDALFNLMQKTDSETPEFQDGERVLMSTPSSDDVQLVEPTLTRVSSNSRFALIPRELNENIAKALTLQSNLEEDDWLIAQNSWNKIIAIADGQANNPTPTDLPKETITREAWLQQCSDRFMQRVRDITRNQASEFAEVCLENIDGDLSEDPVECADEDMSYWTD